MATSPNIPNDITSTLEANNSPVAESAGEWIRFRAVLWALLFSPITAFWAVDQGIDVIFSLMVPPVMMTLLMAGINLFLRKFAPRLSLSMGDLIIFYGMHTVLCAICAEWMSVINPYIHSYALYRSGDTRFDKYINPYISDWFFIPVRLADQFEDYRNGGFGGSYFLTKLPLWWRYIGAWTLLVSLVCLAMLCINSLFRDEWANREKLAFPIIQVPMEIAKIGVGQSKIWKKPTFYIPFITMFVIDNINGLHFVYPSVPLINVRFISDLALLFPNPPLNAVGWTPIGVFPYMAAIGFFMPTDLLFSCIFFFFFRKGMQVFTFSMGYVDSAGTFGGGGLVPSPPYFSEQSWGAFLAIFATSIWVARGYLKEVWQQIRKGHPKGDRGVPHRFAFMGLAASLIALSILTTALGIPFWMTAFSTVLFLMFSVALTRLRAQIGAPSHEMAFMGPNQLLVDFVGTRGISESGISRLVTTFFIYNRIHRTHPMPHQLEAMKMGETAKISQRALFLAIMLAVVIGSVMGHLFYIYKGYRWAAPSAGGDTAWVATTFIEQHRGPNPVAIAFVFIGFAFVLLLDFIRFRVPGFPLHPAGYALAMNFGLDYFWAGLIVVWIIKLFIERYYGLKGHNKLHEIAIGIILAEFCAEAIWATYAMATRTATYSISINGRLGWNQ